MSSDTQIAAEQGPAIEGQEGLGTGPLDARPYFEPGYHELEKERIFSKSWLLVGRIEEIPPRKGFIVREIEVLKASIILVRDDGGATVRGFYNQCKHRLNKLVWEERGSGGAFVCNYHGWTYDRQGELRNMIDEEGFHGLDRKACALTPVHVDTWNGFIFVNLDPNPEQGLMEFLEEIPRLTEGYDFERLSAAAHSEIPLAKAWWIASTRVPSARRMPLGRHSAEGFSQWSEFSAEGNAVSPWRALQSDHARGRNQGEIGIPFLIGQVLHP